MHETRIKGSRAGKLHQADSTRSVHAGEREHQTSDSITTPIHQTSTFWFRNSEELRAYQEGRLARDEYGRYGNPTWRAVERKLADLENAEEAVLFALLCDLRPYDLRSCDLRSKGQGACLLVTRVAFRPFLVHQLPDDHGV